MFGASAEVCRHVPRSLRMRLVASRSDLHARPHTSRHLPQKQAGERRTAISRKRSSKLKLRPGGLGRLRRRGQKDYTLLAAGSEKQKPGKLRGFGGDYLSQGYESSLESYFLGDRHCAEVQHRLILEDSDEHRRSRPPQCCFYLIRAALAITDANQRCRQWRSWR